MSCIRPVPPPHRSIIRLGILFLGFSAAALVPPPQLPAADRDYIAVAFVCESSSADPATFPRTIERVLRHGAIRFGRGRLIDVTPWRADGAGADVLVNVAVARRQLGVQVIRAARGETADRPGWQAAFGAADDAGLVSQAALAAASLVSKLTDAPPISPAASSLPKGALGELEKALAIAARTSDALIERRGRLSAAARSAPDWPLLHLELGRTALEQGDAKAAIEHLTRAFELDQQDPEPRAQLALAYRAIDRHADAVSAYNRALALAPSDPVIHNNLGAALLAAGETAAARKHLEKASEIEPRYPDPLVNLGTYHRLHGREAEAEGFYRKAIGIAPRAPGPRIALAKLFTDAGDHRRAQAELEAAVAASPEHAAARFQLGLVLATRRKYSLAIEQLARVVALAPENREAAYNLALCHHYAGDHGRAIRLVEDRVRREPDYAPYYHCLGLAHEARGENRLAEEAFKMALEKDERFLPAQQALGRLRGARAEPRLAWPWGLLCARREPAQAASPLPASLTLGGLFLPIIFMKHSRRSGLFRADH